MIKPIVAYLINLFKIHIELISILINNLEDLLPLRLACLTRNIKNKILRRKVKFFYLSSKKIFITKDETNIIYFKNKARGFRLYKDGIRIRGQKLADSYFINFIKFNKEDIVIDCGANYGDLFIYLKNKIAPEGYWPIEPNNEAFLSLCYNAPNSKCLNVAFGPKLGFKKFYLCPLHANSSFIKFTSNPSFQKVMAYTVDYLTSKNKFKKIKLLKIEAEGYENEVLLSAKNTLKITEYIALDAGPERGMNQEHTLIDTLNFLLSNNFTILKLNPLTGRCLLKNNSMPFLKENSNKKSIK